MSGYADFLASKFRVAEAIGFDVGDLGPHLFPFQADLVRWACKRGRAAIFADTGLGKTRQELAWSREVAARVDAPILILAPLAVAAQTVREGQLIGVEVNLCRDGADVRPGINVTNYDRLHRFDPSMFGAVVLDESSCIKHSDSKTLAQLMAAFSNTRYRLCATATPAPNDYTELGTHAEFLGICSQAEMLSEFFVHDSSESANTGGWRLKGHARKAFWRWVASWGALLRKPSDLGYSDEGYALPPLNVETHVLALDQSEVFASGSLFAQEARDLSERRNARRASIGKRVAACAEMVKADRERWLIWCELNAEQDALEDEFGDECISIYGSLDPDEKERRLLRFIEGEGRILLGKPSIFGFGLNLQMLSRMAFVGVSDSFESFYQAIRREWRFGQSKPVNVHIFASEVERSVVDNLKRKERDAAHMAEELSAETRDALRAEVLERVRQRHNPYRATTGSLPAWLRTA